MLKKGFGKSEPPTRDAKKFMRAFIGCVVKANGNETKIHQFFKSNRAKLDESLLDALPLVFTDLRAEQLPDERENIALFFATFGDLIQKFPLGNRMLNLELSIAAYNLVMNVYTLETFPEDWAATQNNLGTAYQERIRGERSENLEKAITAFELALQVYTRETFPENWATTQNNLGIIYGERIRGGRSENLEKAITAFELALQVRTLETFPDDWATTQNNLGIFYRNRILGERVENLEKAITVFELALQIKTRKTVPEDWATIQNNLGLAYSERIRGERAENLEKAIAAFELALQVRTLEAFPENWAATQNNLGNVYRERIRGERTENLEKAITAFELALQVGTYEAFPENWAGTQSNLGNVYRDRLRGERAENLEKAIALYHSALQIYTLEAFPENWAMTQNNLGTVYHERLRGERAENLEKAIATFELALQVYTREAFPENWAMVQGNLAGTLLQRALLTENFTVLDTAITLLQSALEVSAINSPTSINIQYALGKALSLRYEHSQNPKDLQQSLQAYKIALDAISPEHYDRKAIWQALPTTQSILGSRLVRDGQWQDGLQLLLNSVNQLSTGDDFLAHANALFQTGRAYETLVDWDKARLYYRDALRLYKHLQDQPGIAKSHTGLGGVLVSQGHLEKGISELTKAQESYHQLDQPEKAAEVESLRQAAQRVMESQMIEAYV
jgi:tetratricopeptide (TPR) repeat protein